MLFSQTVSKSSLEWRNKNHKVMYARLRASKSSLSAIQCYVPTKDDNDKEKDQYTKRNTSV